MVVAHLLHSRHVRLQQVHDVVGRVVEVGAFEDVGNVGDRAVVHDLAALHEDGGIEQVEDLGRRLVDGAENGAAARAKLCNTLTTRRPRTSPGRWSVRQKQAGLRDELDTDGRALLLAAGYAAYHLVPYE